MNIQLHRRARTTPAVWEDLRHSPLSERTRAKKHGVSRATIRQWKRCDSTQDGSHRPHTLPTTLSPA